MPIHINLLAEAQAAEEMRRRDPVKRAIFIGISLIAVALMYYGWLTAKTWLAKGQLDHIQVAIDAKTNAYQSVTFNQKKIADAKNKVATLDKFQAARFLQGSLLNALQHCMVDGVQLINLRVDQSYTVTEGSDGKSGGPARPATSIEKITLRLDARDYSANPGDQVNKFKEAIAKEPYFQAMLSKTNAVQLAGPPSVVQTDGTKRFVTFTLECHFPDKVR